MAWISHGKIHIMYTGQLSLQTQLHTWTVSNTQTYYTDRQTHTTHHILSPSTCWSHTDLCTQTHSSIDIHTDTDTYKWNGTLSLTMTKIWEKLRKIKESLTYQESTLDCNSTCFRMHLPQRSNQFLTPRVCKHKCINASYITRWPTGTQKQEKQLLGWLNAVERIVNGCSHAKFEWSSYL